MKTIIGTKRWLNWNVGEGKRFKNLKELLDELIAMRSLYGSNCGFAGGPIDGEIELIYGMM